MNRRTFTKALASLALLPWLPRFGVSGNVDRTFSMPSQLVTIPTGGLFGHLRVGDMVTVNGEHLVVSYTEHNENRLVQFRLREFDAINSVRGKELSVETLAGDPA